MSDFTSAAADDAGRETPFPSDPISDVLDLLTYRLRVDPELRLEVRRELQSHLDESITELRRAGRGEADARAEAIAALGDASALANELWRANRRRIRARAVAAWAARLLLPPIAVALILLLAYNAVVTWSLSYVTVGQGQFWIAPPNARQRVENYRAKAIAAAPSDAKALFAVEDAWPSERQIERAGELARSRPGDAALYARYAVLESNRQCIRAGTTSDPHAKGFLVVDEPALSQALAAFEEGERRERNNALYPLLMAATLFQVSAWDEADESLTVRRPGRYSNDQHDWSRNLVLDPKRYALALDALHRAALKPYLRSYNAELLDRKMAAFPLRRLADVWARVGQEMQMFSLSGVYFWNAAETAAYAATDAAAQGHRDDAQRILRDIRLLSTAAAASASQPTETQAACWYFTMADQAEARARAALGDSAGAEAAWTKCDQHVGDCRRAFSVRVSHDEKARAGILYASLLNQWTRPGGGRIDPGPMRRAEYAAVDELGVSAVSAAMLILAALYGVFALASWLRNRRRDGLHPLRLTLGWRRTGAIVAVAALGPVLIYLVYARLTWISGRGYGLNVQMRRVGLEYLALAAVVTMLLSYLIRRAIRARAEELGLPVPPRASRHRPLCRMLLEATATLAALACLAGVLFILSGRIPGVSLSTKKLAPFAVGLLAACWGFMALAVVALRNRNAATISRGPGLAGTIARSAFPVVGLAAVVLAVAGLPLQWLESRAVAQAAAHQKSALFLNETDTPDYAALRAELRDQRQQLLHD